MAWNALLLKELAKMQWKLEINTNYDLKAIAQLLGSRLPFHIAIVLDIWCCMTYEICHTGNFMT